MSGNQKRDLRAGEMGSLILVRDRTIVANESLTSWADQIRHYNNLV